MVSENKFMLKLTIEEGERWWSITMNDIIIAYSDGDIKIYSDKGWYYLWGR